MKSDPPQKSPAGLYVVRRKENFIYWAAWKTWYHDALGKNFLPDVMTVFLEFPPETQEAASFVAAQINQIRRDIKWGQMVPERPSPWRRWTPMEMNRIEALERESYATEAMVTPERAASVIELARNRHYRKPKLRVIERAENTALSARYLVTAEELADREQSLVDKRRAFVTEVLGPTHTEIG